ncbi:MAG: Gfo/Idh/MocA family oxidoreductase [Draconibacterium sp.]|nr:Gfo/Idh/MocA family oxidoreductase [Draconibacterium sp.]
MNNRHSRRHFLKTSTTGVAGLIAIPTILSSCAKGANDRILIGHIGVGSRGQDELVNYFLPLESAFQAASCDPFTDRRENVASHINAFYRDKGIKAPECKSYLRFEDILERKDIDAVHITTPDHWHVPLAIKAARAGKHIMLAKPLGLSYSDYKILEKELIANNVKFHYGTQQRTLEHMKLGIEMIKEGLIGEIDRIEVWAPGYNPVESPVCNEVPVPETFDYDRWTGPAPLNPYCPERVTNNGSWFQWDYSIGFLGGWGAHPLDVMIWGMKEKLNGKYTCEGTGGFWQPGGIYNNIRAWDINIEYGTGVKLHFMDTDGANSSGMLNHLPLKDGNGTTFYGSKGWISLGRNSAQSDIPEINSKLNEKEVRGENNTMGQLFVDVVKGNIPEACPLEEAILSDTVSHMSNIAIRTERKINWDPNIGEVVGDAEANSWFYRQHRESYAV